MSRPRLHPAVEAAISEVVTSVHLAKLRLTGTRSYDDLVRRLRAAGLPPPSLRTFMRRRRAILAALAARGLARFDAVCAEVALDTKVAGSRDGAACATAKSPFHAPCEPGAGLSDAEPLAPSSAGKVAAVHHVPLDLVVTAPGGKRLGRPLLTITVLAATESADPPCFEVAVELSMPAGR